MLRCFRCGGSLIRVHRNLTERLRYATLSKCRQCGEYSHDDRWFMMVFGKASRCPECGTYRIYKLKGRDKVDRIYRNPVSYLQRFLGAELRWCAFCRIQFYDLRPRIATPNDRTPIPAVDANVPELAVPEPQPEQSRRPTRKVRFRKPATGRPKLGE